MARISPKRRLRLGWCAAVVLSMMTLVGGTAAAAVRHQPKSGNPAHDKLLSLPPPERAADLARAVGHWCIGTEAFPMGVVADGPGAGNAYWSLRCADGSEWAVQIDRAARVVAIDCAVFKENGAGKECFKKF